MTQDKRPPVWLSIGATAMVAQDLTFFIINPITAFSTIALTFAVLLAWLLLRGSRVAWVFAVFSAAAQLVAPLTMAQSVWLAGTGAILLACLLAPSSRTFIWAKRTQKTQHPWHAAMERLYGRFLATAYALITRIPWVDKAGRGMLIGLLAACVVVLLPLDGTLRNLHHGSGSGSAFVDVFYRIVSFADGLAQVALVIAVVMAIHHYLTKRSSDGR